jgi:succinoglycan biosynthesis protein ExoA
MRVSVIVPVRNEAKHIARTLRGLANQAFPVADYEILVVDGESEDGTRDIVLEHQPIIPNLYLFDNAKCLASAGRNVGVQHARGDFIVIVDGHCQIRDPQYLTKLVAAFESSRADSLGRPQPLRADNPTPFQIAVTAARSSWLGHNPASAIYSNDAGFIDPDNVAVAYRHGVFERVGMFDESFDACEDVEFNTRVRLAGLTCYFAPNIAVEYQPRSTLRGLAYQMARYGRGRAKLARKHLSTVTIPSLVPPAWLVWMVLGIVLSVAWPPFAIVLAASVVVHGSLVFAESVRAARFSKQLTWRRLPLVFVAIHVGFGWGYLRESLAGLPSIPTAVLRRAFRFARRA